MRIETVGRTLVAHIDGDLDHHSTSLVRRELDRVLKRSGVKNLVLDFSELEFMDSSGIGVIIGRYKIVSAIGGTVAVVASKQLVNRIITASGLRKIMGVYKSVPAALKSLKEDVS